MMKAYLKYLCSAVILVAFWFEADWSMFEVSHDAKLPIFAYVCLMPSEDVGPMRSMLYQFSIAHKMSFQWWPLDEQGTAVAIEVRGNGALVFATNNAGEKEVYFNIDHAGMSRNSSLAALSDDLLAEFRKMPGVVAKWRRAPEGYQLDIPPGRRAVRGPNP